ncbi:MAG: hypothetical protein R3F19_15335 [Verrucomicrobiales bacterium]
MDGSFRDGHIVSSSIDYKAKFDDGTDRSTYCCESMRIALSAGKPEEKRRSPFSVE